MADLFIGLGSFVLGVLLIVEGIRGMRILKSDNRGKKLQYWYKEWIIPLVIIGLIILIIVKIIQML